MAGGTFNESGRKRPGTYWNFVGESTGNKIDSVRGVVTIPLVLSWGEPKAFISIQSVNDTYTKLGYDFYDPKMLLIREIVKEATTVLVYRVNTGTKASITFGTPVCTVQAKFGGVRGNSILITSTVNILDGAKKDVATFVNGSVVDVQTVTNIQELVANNWVVFSGTGTVSATAGVTLTGGADGTVVNQDYIDYWSASETQFYNTIALPVDDDTLKTAFISFVKRVREEEGKKIIGVLANKAADYEGIINVKNGVKLEDGTLLDAKQATAWVAGASAGATDAISNTHKTYVGAVDANPRYKNTEIEAALTAAEFVFVNDGEKVIVEQDINSLKTLTDKRNSRFTKNKVMRALDTFETDLSKLYNSKYVGKVPNDTDGQALFKADAVEHMLNKQKDRVLKDVNPEEDFVIDVVKSTGDNVYVNYGITPVDVMEKIYNTVKVR